MDPLGSWGGHVFPTSPYLRILTGGHATLGQNEFLFPPSKMELQNHFFAIPIGSMYGIFTYMWLMLMVNVGKYTIHGSYEIVLSRNF